MDASIRASVAWQRFPDKNNNNMVVVDDDDTLFHHSGQNVVSPDNDGSRSHSGYGFNFCHIMDSLPSICGNSPEELSLVRKTTPLAAIMRKAAIVENEASTSGPVDPMNDESYITVHLPKPIGIRFEENNSNNYGGVFVADIASQFSAAADGSIRRGYQLIAVGEKRVSGLNFDEAVMKPIVDKVEAEVTLVFFTGSAECLYHPSSGATEEWLDSFVAMIVRKQLMKNVEIKDDDDSVIEIVANTTTDDVTNEVERDFQAGIVEEAERTELDLAHSPACDFHDESNYDFFSNVPDLNTTPLFDWTPKKNRIPDVKPVKDLCEAEKENSVVNETNPWRLPDYLAIESSQDDTQEFSSPTQAAEEASLISVEANVDESLNVDESFASKIESALEGGQNGEEETDVVPAEQCEDGEAAYVENNGNCALPHADASYSPCSGFTLRKYGELHGVSEDKVLIRVEATTISTRDCLERIRRDNNEKLKDESWVPGHEIVGRVVRAGIKAKFLLDKRVASLLSHGGGSARYVCIHATDLIAVPETADSNEMVALLSTYMPAYQCLEYIKSENDIDPVRPSSKDDSKPDESPSPIEVAGKKRSPLSGSCVLITGAGSPVGLALIDIAKNAGATVHAVSHSSYEQAIREMGVNEWYPLFRKNQWKSEWKGKMNLIVDTVGDYDLYKSFYEVMTSDGRFVRMNTTSCEKKYVPILAGEQDKGFSVLKDYKGSRINNMAIDYNVFKSFNDDQELFTEDLAYLYHLLQIGKIEPKVFSRVGFDELQEEWEKVLAGGASGVVVVSPWND